MPHAFPCRPKPGIAVRTLATIAALATLALGVPGCRRHHHHHDGGMVAAPGYGTPGTFPGQLVPGMIPQPGMPGALGVPGVPGMGIVAPSPIATAPDNPMSPIPPPGVMRQFPQPP